MIARVYFFQSLIRNVRINLCCGDGGVAEEGLDAADIGAVLKQVGGEAVAQGVGVDVFDDTGGDGVVLDDAFDGARGEAE